MKHYVCPICGGVSDHPKMCETPGCANSGHELVECNCTDNAHTGVLRKCEHCGKICEGNCAIEPYKEELPA